ncbi:hypothetical protein M3Y99_01341500 [Aphelenchoides fujianensis]|nr:hypothetical protein M3Y99_01341500 [Aphelenchoides fujianensis]
MRLIQQKAWTHPTTPAVSTTTPLPARSVVALSLNEGAAKHAPTPLTQFAQPEAVRPSFSHRTGGSTVTAAQMAFRSTQPTVEPTDERVGSTAEAEAIANNNIRRQSLRTGSSFTSVQPQQVVPSAQPATWESLAAGLEKPPPKPSRAFGERTQHFVAASRISFPGRRITGPILAPLFEDSGAPPTGGSFGHARQQLPFAGGESGAFGGRSQLPVAQPTGNEEEGPTIVPDFGHSALPGTNGEDYHHRQSGMRAEHRFKLVSNRLVPRPRLKIRTHDEPRAQGDSTNSNTGPISLPELATFDGFPNPTGVSPRRPLPTAPTKPAATGPSDFVSSGRPRHVPRVTAWGDEDVEAIRGGPRPTAPSEFAAPTEETTGESGANFGGASPPATEEVGGDSAVGFGAPVGTPPPGFSEAFGLNGASMPLDPNADLLAPAPPAPVEETPPPTQRPRPRPTTTNAAPVVVPENSGLRPATPPKEFQGGFGSSGRGSPFGGGGGGGFGGGSGGFGGPSDSGLGGGAAVEPTPAAGGRGKGRKKGRKGGRQPPKKPTPEPAPELKEEDFFTGESALTPNVRGPTGDGYGPPVLPGSAIPPAVSALSAGGTAAGIPPAPSPPSSYQGMSMDVTENTPTTVKPSALLNILNRADQSFNQMLTNFESGAPLESAAIDILEVALGSQKLDSQAKLLGHVDRTFGLDNLQRLQRWANTGGALDEFKEQLVKVAKNFKPPPETNAITIPPQLEYLFQSSG